MYPAISLLVLRFELVKFFLIVTMPNFDYTEAAGDHFAVWTDSFGHHLIRDILMTPETDFFLQFFITLGKEISRNKTRLRSE
jgi:hypothetical protein